MNQIEIETFVSIPSRKKINQFPPQKRSCFLFCLTAAAHEMFLSFMQEALLISLSGLREKIASVFPDLSKGWPQEVHVKDYRKYKKLSRPSVHSNLSIVFELMNLKCIQLMHSLSMYILWIILYRLFISLYPWTVMNSVRIINKHEIMKLKNPFQRYTFIFLRQACKEHS